MRVHEAVPEGFRNSEERVVIGQTSSKEQTQNGARGGLQIEAALEATSQAERTEAERQQVAYALSHDLTQPLTTISGFADLLDRRYRERFDADADEFIDFILRAATQLRAMLDDLKLYLGISEKLAPPAPVDCSRVVQAVVDSIATPMAETRATVTVETLPNVRGDSAQIGQLFLHLISNGLKFRGETAPRIRVSGTREEGHTRFSVSDNGPGIEPAQSERAFELFQRLHGASSTPGTGAGLAICKKIVERHGGRIWVEPAAGGGSCFQFTIADRA
jgi:light-regulated signal transduction histidine kinase (bacteriophytochrome)